MKSFAHAAVCTIAVLQYIDVASAQNLRADGGGAGGSISNFINWCLNGYGLFGGGNGGSGGLW